MEGSKPFEADAPAAAPVDLSKMKLGVAYNVFDGEELLLDSIKSVRSNVAYVAVVYQTVSNFGNACHPELKKRLEHLVSLGLVDELRQAEPREFSDEEKHTLCSPVSQELGGPPTMVSQQFFNEVSKRDIGRQMCHDAGCTHFMSMDTDEFYHPAELEHAKRRMLAEDLDGSCCKMRFYFRDPEHELLPFDEYNQVPLIYKLKKGSRLLLAHPYPCVVDPTRRMGNCPKFVQFEREEVEMHHFSFVRADIGCKMRNVSNRDNHDGASAFLRDFEHWTPEMGVIHPHPWGRKVFQPKP